MTENDNINRVLEGLLTRYIERVPDVDAISRTMMDQGLIESRADIENDHIAFRTMGVPVLGIQSLEQIFLHFGYERRDYYPFEDKKLNAYWYAPPTPGLPRIFISELRVHDLSPEAQDIILSYTDEVKADPVESIDLDDPVQIDAFLHKSLWRLPSWADYTRLLKESEYAAWVIYNRYYLNHYTIAVHNLPEGYRTILQFNTFLKANGFRLNNAGGEIKISADGLLIQSATVAKTMVAEFADGDKHAISGSYVEFIERKARPEFRHLDPNALEPAHRREGFEAGNADKIFESTYSSQTGVNA